MADAAAVDAALQRILAVTLIESTANASARPPVLFLKGILEVKAQALAVSNSSSLAGKHESPWHEQTMESL